MMTVPPAPRSPLVLVASNRIPDYKGTPAYVLRDTYVQALVEIAGCTPMMFPLSYQGVSLKDFAGRIDGVLLTGSSSHMDPARYGAAINFDAALLDPARDATTLSLLAAAIEMDIPVLGICRRFQELNVACGGTLHQAVQTVEGKRDHRHDEMISMRQNYAARAHRVRVEPGGLFSAWGFMPEFSVNSLHEQGVDRLGKNLRAEAVSDDGLIEAASMPDKRFVVGVQWHPEGDTHISVESQVLFERFGQALRGGLK